MEYVSFAEYYVGAAGVALTLFLLIFMGRLLGRSARVVSLENELLVGQAQEQATRAWAEKLSLAVEQNPAAIIITDTEGRIEYANDTFLECSGYSLNEVIGQTPRLLIRPDLSMIYAAYFTRVSWKNFRTRSGDFSSVCMCSVVAAFSLALVRTGTFV